MWASLFFLLELPNESLPVLCYQFATTMGWYKHGMSVLETSFLSDFTHIKTKQDKTQTTIVYTFLCIAMWYTDSEPYL